jgi:recombination protein RecA
MSTSAFAIRSQIEAVLAGRIPSALTLAHRPLRANAPTGICSLDKQLYGGLPLGAITEVVGPECSGRTALALSYIAQIMKEGKVCAWVDASDSLHLESAAGAGIDLARLLWVRCGVPSTSKEQLSAHMSFALPEKYLAPPQVKKGIHGGGCGPHPRGETKGLPDAVEDFLRPEHIVPRCAEPQRRVRPQREVCEPILLPQAKHDGKRVLTGRPWARIEQALHVTDLLLQGGGFGAIVLDMGSIAPEFVSRVPLATWFRYRAAAERTRASILVLTQHPCTKSSAGLVLCMQPGNPLQDDPTVFAGVEHQVEIVRERFSPTPTNVIPLPKPPHSDKPSGWYTRTAWTGRR